MSRIASEGGHHKFEDKGRCYKLRVFRCIYDSFSEVGEEVETQEERREMQRRGGEDWSILSTGGAELSRCISPATHQSTETFPP